MFLVNGYNGNYKLLDEVDINGQSMSNEDDNEGGDYTTPEPVNAAGADNNTPAEENPPPDEGSEDTADYTADSDQGNDMGAEGGDVHPEEGTDPNAGEDTDYTDGGDMGAEGGDVPPEDGGAAPSGDGQVTADDARGMEQEIFKDLTPDQVDLKHKELKNNFLELYDSTSNIIDRVNEIPPNEEFIASISFVSKQLSNLRQMVADYMNNVYSTKSYMENAMNYNRFLAVLNSINDILEEIDKELSKNE